MPVQNDSIIYCIKYTKFQKEQNLLTFFSIIPGKESSQGTYDKVRKLSNKQTSQNQYWLMKRRKKTKAHSPQLQTLLYFAFKTYYTSYHVLN